MFDKVFISYASEDLEYADKMYDFLEAKGLNPWLDKKKLRVGANWDIEINRALKTSSFILLLLSSNSVSKRGYVQKEYKLALTYAQEKLEDDIFIIPILIDNCVIPEGLKKFQWKKYDDNDSFEEIFDSITFQILKYSQNLFPVFSDDEFYEKKISLGIDYANELDFNCKIPQFSSSKYFDKDFINSAINFKVNQYLSSIRKHLIEDDYYNEHLKTYEYFNTLFVNMEYKIYTINTNLLSIGFYLSSYLRGAHENFEIQTLNILFKPERFIKFFDVISIYSKEEFFTTFKKFIDPIVYDYFMNDKIALDYFNLNEIDILFDKDSLIVDLQNELPFVYKALGEFKIPFSTIEKKVLKDIFYLTNKNIFIKTKYHANQIQLHRY
ncbi:MAG TPA: toll/interleukin-1 receptor domain-containing protein [Chitinophagales bacterium]|nr:toll/interleukin-1 receptor domain-containing protein [Chitinophagales bacterium]